MWIIPKTLSAFVQDTEGLNLVSSEQAWMLEQSVTWRSKFMSRQYWSKRWKKGDYVQHLCGLMPKPSLHQSFVEKYTASLPDIHVSHSVARGSEKEKKTQGTYGHTSDSTSGQLDLFGAFSKMSEATPRWGYGESCPIWKKMVTERSGDCSARRKQARLTNASECSSWPTASARDHKGGYTGGRIRNGKVSMDTLDVAVQAHTKGGILDNWPTPRAGNPGSRKPGTGGKILAEEAKKNWPTPRETMSRDATHDRGKCNLGEVVHGIEKQLTGPPAQEKSSTSGKNHGSPKLNPNWVEQLMGLPIGWTDLGSWATESSHKQQN